MIILIIILTIFILLFVFCSLKLSSYISQKEFYYEKGDIENE